MQPAAAARGRIPFMAVLMELRVYGTRGDFESFAARVEEYLETSGAPPPGLLAHVAYPVDGGWVSADVYRDEASWRAFAETALYPAYATLGLTTDEVVVRPVWNLARP